MSNEHVTVLYHFWLLLIAKSWAGWLCSPFSFQTVFRLNRNPAEKGAGKINDMSYISLFRYVFTKPFVCIWDCVCVQVQSYVCLLVSSLNGQGPLTHQHVFLITVLHSSLSPAGASRLCATAGDGAVSHEAATHGVWWSFPCPSSCMSICLSGEAPLLKDGNVISWPLDPEVAAMQPRFHAGWYVKCVPDSLSTNT